MHVDSLFSLSQFQEMYKIQNLIKIAQIDICKFYTFVSTLLIISFSEQFEHW